MDASIWAFIGVVVGAIVGASASIITTVMASSATLRLQREVNAHERMERARAFQRDTLLAVQDTLHEALRLMARSHLQDLDLHRKGGAWGKGMLGDEVSDSTLTTNRRLAILNERIADDLLRKELKKLRAVITQVLFATSEDEGEAMMKSAASQADNFLENLGNVLRNQY